MSSAVRRQRLHLSAAFTSAVFTLDGHSTQSFLLISTDKLREMQFDGVADRANTELVIG